jgi:hypothetical protein
MKRFAINKLFSFILIIALLFTLSSTNIYADIETTNMTEVDMPELTFTDLPESHWSYPYVQYMVSQKIIEGYPDNTFRPDEPFSRAAFAKLLSLSFDMEDYNEMDTVLKDIPPTHWAYNYVMSAFDYLTIFDFGNGVLYYYPDEPSVREDVAVAMVKAMGLDLEKADLSVLDAYLDSKEISHSIRPYVALAVEHGVMKGSGGYFKPVDSLTRAEACTLFARFLQDIKGNISIEGVKVPAGALPFKKGHWNLVDVIDEMPKGLQEINQYGDDNYATQLFTSEVGMVSSELVVMRLREEGYLKEYIDTKITWDEPKTYYKPDDSVTFNLSAEITRFERYQTNFSWTFVYAYIGAENDIVPTAYGTNMMDAYDRKIAQANINEGAIDVGKDTVIVTGVLGIGEAGDRKAIQVAYSAPAGQISGRYVYVYEYLE